MEQFNISIELTNKILAYLGTKPFSEVEGLINEIREAYTKSQAPTTELAAKKGDKKA